MNKEEKLREQLTALERIAGKNKSIKYECPECGGGFHDFKGFRTNRRCPFCETKFGEEYQ